MPLNQLTGLNPIQIFTAGGGATTVSSNTVVSSPPTEAGNWTDAALNWRGDNYTLDSLTGTICQVTNLGTGGVKYPGNQIVSDMQTLPVAAATNGKPGFIFDGYDDYYRLPPGGMDLLNGVTGYCIMMVYKSTAPCAAVTITNATGDGAHITYTASAPLPRFYRVGAAVTTTGNLPAGYNLNGVTLTSVTSNTFTVANAFSTAFTSGGAGNVVTNQCLFFVNAGTYSSVTNSNNYRTLLELSSNGDGTGGANVSARKLDADAIASGSGGSTSTNLPRAAFGIEVMTVDYTQSVSITGAVGDGVHITYTFSGTAPTEMTVGENATIIGVTPSGYNLTNVAITAVTANTFTVANAFSTAYTSGGVANFTNCKIYNGLSLTVPIRTFVLPFPSVAGGSATNSYNARSGNAESLLDPAGNGGITFGKIGGIPAFGQNADHCFCGTLCELGVWPLTGATPITGFDARRQAAMTYAKTRYAV